ncbi:hypothetical protein EYC80_002028 [Monilinia laxa]|uniref:Major facilitator superfamily (MFS) profile domain-containing protein n=1 Tax=Monilinia laxa TaxID=61186 RepID=A0A5N6K6Z7_MONLA|nr:hypothetical protein EYC80_002028 [Monilinia laxa]
MQTENSQHTTTVALIVTILAVIAVALRFVTRRLTKAGIAADDWWILMGLLLLIITGAVLLYGVKSDPNGGETINRDSPTFDYTPHVVYLQMSWAAAILYFSVVTAIKISILLMYRRIFSASLVRSFWVFMGLVVVWWLVGTVATCISCVPASRFWTGPSAGGWCFNFNIYWMVMGLIEIIVDIGILVLPIGVVVGLQMPNSQKILVAGIFLLGSFVVITGVVRVVLGYAPGSQNVDFPRAELWSTVHVGMAIVCACLPNFRPLLNRITASARRLYGSAITSDRNPNASGSSGSRSGVSKNKNAAELMTLGNIRRPKPNELEDTNADTRRLTRNGSGDLESRSLVKSRQAKVINLTFLIADKMENSGKLCLLRTSQNNFTTLQVKPLDSLDAHSFNHPPQDYIQGVHEIWGWAVVFFLTKSSPAGMAPSTTITTNADDRPMEVVTFSPGKRYIAACISILSVNLACALDATTIAVALPAISEALNGNAIEAFWAGTSFLLTSTIWQPIFVAFSHVFGRKPLLLFSLILFTIGSVLGGAAHNTATLLTGRCIQGSGVGGILVLTEALITDTVPLRQRGNAMASLGVVWAVGSVTGPLIGGALANRNAWRWVFYLNLPIIAVGFVGCVWFLQLERKERTFEEKLSEIDYIGSIIFVGSLTSFLIPLTWGGVAYSWKSWHTLVPLLLGAVGLLGFCAYEGMVAQKPILPTRLFRNPSSNIAYLCTFLHGMILWTIVYYVPLYFMSVQSYTSVMAGIAALPETLTIAPFAIVFGIIATKTGSYRWGLWIGWAITAFGCGMLYLLDVGTSVFCWIFLMLGSGIGMGLLYPALSLAIQASAPVEDAATAARLFTFFRALDQTVGVAI